MSTHSTHTWSCVTHPENCPRELERPMTAIAFYPRELYALREVLATDQSRRPEYGAFYELRDLLARVESAIVATENARR